MARVSAGDGGTFSRLAIASSRSAICSSNSRWRVASLFGIIRLVPRALRFAYPPLDLSVINLEQVDVLEGLLARVRDGQIALRDFRLTEERGPVVTFSGTFVPPTELRETSPIRLAPRPRRSRR